MIVAFVADARAAVADMLKAEPGMLRAVALDERHVLTQGDAPVRWWRATEVSKGRTGAS